MKGVWVDSSGDGRAIHKGSSLREDWLERAARISPSIPVAIHDDNMPSSGDDEFSRLSKDIKKKFDEEMGKR